MTQGSRKVPSLLSPVPARQDAQAPQIRGVPQLRGGRRDVGLQLASVPEVVPSYQEGGLEELLKSRVSERGRQELVTHEAFEDLKEAMKRGEIATIGQADEFLSERHGIEYAHPDGVGQLLRRRKVKLKTGRPRHEEADPLEQEAFKKTSPARSRRKSDTTIARASR